MTEIHVELPVKINGIFITHSVHSLLSELQAEGSLHWDGGPVYNNAGIAFVENDVNELNNYFIQIIATAGTDEPTEREKNMLGLLYWIRDKIISLKVPAEFLTK